MRYANSKAWLLSGIVPSITLLSIITVVYVVAHYILFHLLLRFVPDKKPAFPLDYSYNHALPPRLLCFEHNLVPLSTPIGVPMRLQMHKPLPAVLNTTLLYWGSTGVAAACRRPSSCPPSSSVHYLPCSPGIVINLVVYGRASPRYQNTGTYPHQHKPIYVELISYALGKSMNTERTTEVNDDVTGDAVVLQHPVLYDTVVNEHISPSG